MNDLLIVANIKSFQNESEAKNWIEEFTKNTVNLDNKQIIICPPFTLLSLFYSKFKDSQIKIGAQNVSPFDEGAYTGEINAKQIKDFASFIIVGHSERRNNFSETDEMINKKADQAVKYGLTPIVCVQDSNTPIPPGTKIIAYEPVFAIGSGNPDTPENASAVAKEFINKDNNLSVLYGGSVTSENVADFTKQENIKGVLVGGASLDPLEFIKIIENA